MVIKETGDLYLILCKLHRFTDSDSQDSRFTDRFIGSHIHRFANSSIHSFIESQGSQILRFTDYNII